MEIVCLIIAGVLLLIYKGLSIWESSLKMRSEERQWRFRIVKFIVVLLAGGSIFYGYEFGQDGITDFTGGWSAVIEFARNILESWYKSLKLFFADGTLMEIKRTPITPNIVRLLYYACYYALCIISVWFTATTVASFFKGYADWKMLKNHGRTSNICVFSELSENTLAIAEGIIENTRSNAERAKDVSSCGQEKKEKRGFFTRSPRVLDNDEKKLFFVFCDVYSGCTENAYELTERAREMGALCLKDDIIEVHERLKKYKVYKKSEERIIRYFLASVDEAENIHQSIAIADIEKKAPEEKQMKNLAIFTFASGEANGNILDSLNVVGTKKANFFVRRLNPALILAYGVVANKENHLIGEQDKEKDLCVLVVGGGKYGLEIAKMLCWFYQRRVGGITVHIVDRGSGIEDYMSAVYPELISYNATTDKQDDSQFKIVFHENTEVYSSEFGRLLQNELKDIDAAYIALGDDDINTEAAMHTRVLLDRAHYNEIVASENEKKKYVDNNAKIFAIIHSDRRAKNLRMDANNRYDIRFVGTNQDLYSYKNLYNYKIEVEAIAVHKETERKKNRNLTEEELHVNTINSYHSDEYLRLSSLANAYHNKFIETLYGEVEMPADYEDTEEQRKEYADGPLEIRRRIENKRWNAYMRASGSVCMDCSMNAEVREELFTGKHGSARRRWNRGKWHNSIAAYSAKGSAEQKNNWKYKANEKKG